jgi:hypothetical protein
MWHTWERRGNCTVFWWGKPEGKRPLGRPRSRWENGMRKDLRGMGWGSVEWIQLVQDRDRWRTHKYGDEPSGSGATKLVILIAWWGGGGLRHTWEDNI